MKKILSDDNGNITIFYSIIIIAMIFILFIMIDSCRIIYSNNKLKRATQVALHSVLADYNKELKENYNLLSLRDLDEYVIEEKIKDEIEKNLSSNDMSDISIQGINIINQDCLSNLKTLDEQIKIGTEIFNMQRIKSISLDLLMKIIQNKKGIEEIKVTILSKQEYEDIESFNYEDKRKKNIDDTNEYINEGEANDIVISDNLRKYINVNGKRNEIKEYTQISNDINYMYEEIKNNYFFDNYINDYILNNFKHHNINQIQPMKDTYFNYEIEYIVSGLSSQNENIKDTKTKMILLRIPNNIINVYNNFELMSCIERKAQLMVGWWGTELAATIVKNALVLSEALHMSKQDVILMLNNQKIEFINESGIYIDYETCLYFLLLNIKKEIKLERIRDLIFLNMNKINNQFTMEKTKSMLEVEVIYNEKLMFLDKITLFNINPYKVLKVTTCATY